MTKHEFETRTKMKISEAEFKSINDVYMMTDLDKDQFCEWFNINSHAFRVRKIREEVEEGIKQEKKRKLEIILEYLKYTERRGERWYPAMLSDSEAETLNSAGIDVNVNIYMLIDRIESSLAS